MRGRTPQHNNLDRFEYTEFQSQLLEENSLFACRGNMAALTITVILVAGNSQKTKSFFCLNIISFVTILSNLV
jgi:hypothetical protein